MEEQVNAATAPASAGVSGEAPQADGGYGGRDSAGEIDTLLLERFQAFEDQIGGMLDERLRGLDRGGEEEGFDPDALARLLEDPDVLSDEEGDGYDGELDGFEDDDELEGAGDETEELRAEVERAQFEAQRAQLHAAGRDLEARYPGLRDERTAIRAMQGAADLAARAGLSPEQGAMNPALIEAAYLAQAARIQAESEVPAGGKPVELESAGGSQGGSAEPNTAQAILTASRNPNMTREAQAMWGA